MSSHKNSKTIALEGFWTPQDEQEFDSDFKATLQNVEDTLPIRAFCPIEGTISGIDFFQVDLKRFTSDKAVGIINVTVVDRLLLGLGGIPLEKHKNVRFGFDLDRKSGELRVGKGFCENVTNSPSLPHRVARRQSAL